MADKDMGDVLGGDPFFFQRVKNERSLRNHAGIGDQRDPLAPDQGNRPRHMSGAVISHTGHGLASFYRLDIAFKQNGDGVRVLCFLCRYSEGCANKYCPHESGQGNESASCGVQHISLLFAP